MSKQIKSAAPHRAGYEKAAVPKNTGVRKTAQGVPLIAVYWAIGMGALSYIASRFAVSEHPLHWASLAGGVLLGIVIGYIWYFIRGDVGLI